MILFEFLLYHYKYYIVDLKAALARGEMLFCNDHHVHFSSDLPRLETVDVVYVGSTLEYISSYRDLIEDFVNYHPQYIFFANHYMGNALTYATAQVNTVFQMPYWIFNLEEIVNLLAQHQYHLIYKSSNYFPQHTFDNFPESYRIEGPCNLLFSFKEH